MKNKKPSGRIVSGETYDETLEDYNRKQNLDKRNMEKQPAGLANALTKGEQGYSDKPRVKPNQTKCGKLSEAMKGKVKKTNKKIKK
jgi:hypothetical protein